MSVELFSVRVEDDGDALVAEGRVADTSVTLSLRNGDCWHVIDLKREEVRDLADALEEWHRLTGTCVNGHYNADVYVKDGGTCKYCGAPIGQS